MKLELLRLGISRKEEYSGEMGRSGDRVRDSSTVNERRRAWPPGAAAMPEVVAAFKPERLDLKTLEGASSDMAAVMLK